jgi:hypothetical protein
LASSKFYLTPEDFVARFKDFVIKTDNTLTQEAAIEMLEMDYSKHKADLWACREATRDIILAEQKMAVRKKNKPKNKKANTATKAVPTTGVGVVDTKEEIKQTPLEKRAQAMAMQVPACATEVIEGQCVVCLDAASTHCMTGCGHLCLCAQCADLCAARGTCPICTTPGKAIMVIKV